jgi:hypothetical protein
LLQKIEISASVEVVSGFNAVLMKNESDEDFGRRVHEHEDGDPVFTSGLSQITFAPESHCMRFLGSMAAG